MDDPRPAVFPVFCDNLHGQLEHRGTAFCVAPGYVLTCDHVLREKDPRNRTTDILCESIYIRVNSTFKRAVYVEPKRTPRWDIALLRVDQLTAYRGVSLLADVAAEHITRLYSTTLHAYGFDAAEQESEAGVYHVHLTGPKVGQTLEHAQLTTSLIDGCSGAPVLVPQAGTPACLGLVYLGGERASKSRMLGAGAVRQFLHSLDIDVTTVPADTVLRSAHARSERVDANTGNQRTPRDAFRTVARTRGDVGPSHGDIERHDGKVVGIDLGTSTAAIAMVEGDHPTVFINTFGSKLTPSVIAVAGEERLVGHAASCTDVGDATCKVRSSPRLLGRRSDQVRLDTGGPHDTGVKSGDTLARVAMGGKEYLPQEVVADILGYLKTTAEDYVGCAVEDAVISIPTGSDFLRRQAIKEAAEIAGLRVHYLVDSSTAAGVAYGLQNVQRGQETVVVADFGAGTFDVSILEMEADIGTFQVKATNCAPQIGGDDIDHALTDHLAERFQREHGVNLREDPVTLYRLREAAESAKCELSDQMETVVDLSFNAPDLNARKHLQTTVTRATLESLIKGMIRHMRMSCEECLQDSGVTRAEIDQIVLIGGQCRMPAIQNLMVDVFGTSLNRSVDSDTAVAIGTAKLAHEQARGSDSGLLLLDVNPLSVGIETADGTMARVVRRNRTVPGSGIELLYASSGQSDEINIRVLQGEQGTAERNLLLADINRGAPRPVLNTPAGSSRRQLRVECSIDSRRDVNVRIAESSRSPEHLIEISGVSGIEPSDLEMTKAQFQLRWDTDRQRKLIESKNWADALAYQVRQNMKEYGDKCSAETQMKIWSALSDVERSAKGDSKARLDNAIRELEQVAVELGRAAFEAGSQQGADSDRQGGGR